MHASHGAAPGLDGFFLQPRWGLLFHCSGGKAGGTLGALVLTLKCLQG